MCRLTSTELLTDCSQFVEVELLCVRWIHSICKLYVRTHQHVHSSFLQAQLVGSTKLNPTRLILHDALCVFSQISGSHIRRAFVRPEMLWCRAAHSPKDAGLCGEMKPVTVVVGSIGCYHGWV